MEIINVTVKVIPTAAAVLSPSSAFIVSKNGNNVNILNHEN